METITHIAGAPADSVGDLQERVRVVEGKVERDAQEIVEVLRIDLLLFMERQAKERYTQAPPSFQLTTDRLNLEASS